MTSFDSLPPMGREGPSAGRERTLARDVMEVAVFLSARAGDSDAFQRHMAQVCGCCGCFLVVLLFLLIIALGLEVRVGGGVPVGVGGGGRGG